jgi:hypothetical protein
MYGDREAAASMLCLISSLYASSWAWAVGERGWGKREEVAAEVGGKAWLMRAARTKTG